MILSQIILCGFINSNVLTFKYFMLVIFSIFKSFGSLFLQHFEYAVFVGRARDDRRLPHAQGHGHRRGRREARRDVGRLA